MFIGNLLIYKHGGIRNGKSSSSLESLVDKYHYGSACRVLGEGAGKWPTARAGERGQERLRRDHLWANLTD